LTPGNAEVVMVTEGAGGVTLTVAIARRVESVVLVAVIVTGVVLFT
jgi:hypothetical protein